jgi:hypothetical protein
MKHVFYAHYRVSLSVTVFERIEWGRGRLATTGSYAYSSELVPQKP